MKTQLTLLFVVGLLAVSCICAAYEKDGNVAVLTDSNFDDVIDGSQYALVEFYAPWCGHCKNLAPEYEKAAKAFSKVKNVLIAKVDATEQTELASRFGVKGYPTLKWFKLGSTEASDYDGGRSEETIVSWINNNAGTNVKVVVPETNVVVLTPDNFDKVVLDESKDVLVKFYAPWCGHCKSLAPKYEQVADIYAGEDEVVVAHIDVDNFKEIGSKYGVTGFPTLKWFPRDDKAGVAYEGGRDVKDFVKHINEKSGMAYSENGDLLPEAGRVDTLDELAGAFTGKESEIEAAVAVAADLTGKDAVSAKYYIRVMQNIVKKGAEFPTKEAERLGRILGGSSVTAKKSVEFGKRINILSVFSEQA